MFICEQNKIRTKIKNNIFMISLLIVTVYIIFNNQKEIEKRNRKFSSEYFNTFTNISKVLA